MRPPVPIATAWFADDTPAPTCDISCRRVRRSRAPSIPSTIWPITWVSCAVCGSRWSWLGRPSRAEAGVISSRPYRTRSVGWPDPGVTTSLRSVSTPGYCQVVPTGRAHWGNPNRDECARALKPLPRFGRVERLAVTPNLRGCHLVAAPEALAVVVPQLLRHVRL